MSIQDRLTEDLKDAMRSGDTVARETIRMVLAAFKNRRIELGKDLYLDTRLSKDETISCNARPLR